MHVTRPTTNITGIVVSGKSSRRKGHDYEREIARDMRSLFGNQVKRGLQSRNGTFEPVPDVDVPIFWIECKRGKRTNIKAALRQAQRDTDGRTPVAVCRDDRDRAIVAMDYTDWLQMVERTLNE